MWRLSGIHRHVSLLVKPATHIADFTVRTPLTFKYGSTETGGSGAGGTAAAELVGAKLEVEVMVAGPSNEELAGRPCVNS